MSSVIPEKYHMPLIMTGLGVQAFGQARAGREAARAGEENQERILEETALLEQQQRRTDQEQLARARAASAASGFAMTGTPLEVMAESERQAELNAWIVRRGGQLRAEAARRAGRQARRAGYWGAAGTLLSGLPTILGRD